MTDREQTEAESKFPPFWIFKTVWVCPICLSERVYRDRRYEPKPSEPFKRQKRIETWDGCDA